MTEAEIQKIENEKRNTELVQCYKRMAKTDDGKKIMEDLEIFCGAKRVASDREWLTNKTFFHDGMRNVYLYIRQRIERKEEVKEKQDG